MESMLYKTLLIRQSMVVKNGRVVAVSADKAVTKIESGNSDYSRSGFIGTILDVLVRTFDGNGNVTSTKQSNTVLQL